MDGVAFLDSVEKAIRNALAKGNASDPVFREKVYRSAFAALDKATATNAAISPEAADHRRKVLADQIRAIEEEFLDTPTPSEQVDESLAQDADDLEDDADLSDREAPEIEIEDRRAPNRELPPEFDVERGDRDTAVVEKKSRGRRKSDRRRRPFSWFFVIALVIATVGIGIWWTKESGILLSRAERDTSVPNPPTTLSSEDYRPGNGELPMRQSEGQHRSWIKIFTPDDPTTVSTQSRATAEIVGEDKEKALRIRSATAEDAVIFDVGPGILEQLAGKTAVFDIIASSEENKPAEISVRCGFGKLGDCVRKRYSVGLTPNEYLFEIHLADAVPDKGGSIEIVSDVNGTGLAVDIREIRVAEEK
jgi:hypothetical protein